MESFKIAPCFGSWIVYREIIVVCRDNDGGKAYLNFVRNIWSFGVKFVRRDSLLTIKTSTVGYRFLIVLLTNRQNHFFFFFFSPDVTQYSAFANSAERQPSGKSLLKPSGKHFLLDVPKIRLITDGAHKACSHSQM